MPSTSPLPAPPLAEKRPHERTAHGDTVIDPYSWMSDRDDPALLEYLAAENAYAEARTAHLTGLRAELYDDIAARTKQTDLTVPTYVPHTSGERYWYYNRTTEGLDYPISCRLPATTRDDIPDATERQPEEQVVLDLNALAEGADFLALGWAEASPDGRLLAYSVDTRGDERYALYVAEIATGQIVDGPIERVGAGGAWAGDGWLFYTRVDAAWRPHEVWRHRVGTAPAGDTLVTAEQDERFWIGVESARGYRWVVIEIGSRTTTECLLVPTDDPTAEPRCVAPRREGVDYTVEVATEALYVVHNDDAPQFMLSTAPLDATGPQEWTTLLPEDPRRRLTGVTAYDVGLVVSHRTDGMTGVSLLRRRSDGRLEEELDDLAFGEALYTVDAEEDADFATDRIRLAYESMVTPPSIIEYRFDTGNRTVLKETPVLDHPTSGPYDRTRYVSERVWATAADGTPIPMSVVRRADVALDGTAPCLMYGYGSYEHALNPTFSISRLSLLDRGFVYAIAHVRGGGELGRPWYDAGKMMSKVNTIRDFLACAAHLVGAGYAAADRLVAEGGSAGGLLMGAVANLAPDQFRAIHAAVPFVDALTTILNPDLPLTVMEWEEWGDPLHDPEAYAYLKSYSPYENVTAGPYPAILATTSLNDTRVEVTEPAKWVARLRECATNPPDRPILLKTEMVAGHGGASARYHSWRERAFELAWIIDQAGASAS